MSDRRRLLARRPVLWTSAIVVPLVIGAAIVVPMAASGAVNLPDKTAQELIEFAAASKVGAFSGTIEQTSPLGLPDLGALTKALGASDHESSAAGINDVIALVTGSHTAKVYLDGQSARLQVLDQLGERDVYVDGAAHTGWYVDSETQTATKLNLPASTQKEAADPGSALPTPDTMLSESLAKLDKTTQMTVGTDSRVAGRDVYELILKPRTTDTLIGEVRFAIDGENGVALAASITARGASTAAFEIAFTQIDFSAPDSAVFAFTPGTGITVTQKDIASPNRGQDVHAQDGMKPDAATPTTFGEGWSAVVELPNTSKAGQKGVMSGLDPQQRAMLDSVTTAVRGGRVVQTALVSVLITDDGRVLAGAVPASRLVEAAQTGQ